MRFLLATLALAALVSMPAAAQQAERRISVSGQGEVSAVPDMALISMGVEAEGATARAAMDQTSAAMTAMLARLEQAGIAARDVQTSSLQLSPRWVRPRENAPQEIDGFTARNQLTVRVRELDRLGAVMEAVLAEGANTFDDLRFAVSDRQAMEARARTLAVEDAMARAAHLAEAAGVTLGPVQRIDESGGVRPMMRDMAMASEMASPVPMAPGEMSISAQVAMVFSIED